MASRQNCQTFRYHSHLSSKFSKYLAPLMWQRERKKLNQTHIEAISEIIDQMHSAIKPLEYPEPVLYFTEKKASRSRL